MIYLKFMEIYFTLILKNQILSLIETFYLFVISTRNILHLDRLQDPQRINFDKILSAYFIK